MDLTQTEQSLGQAGSTLSGYTKDLPSEIQAEVQKAWTPALKRVTGETQRMMSEFLPRYWGIGEQLGGTTAADLSPTQKMQVMGRELGTMGGQLSSNAMLADYLGGKASDMYNKAVQNAQMGYGFKADAYAREFDKYQLAWQEAEAEKDRALQRQLAAQQLGSQPDWGSMLDQYSGYGDNVPPPPIATGGGGGEAVGGETTGGGGIMGYAKDILTGPFSAPGMALRGGRAAYQGLQDLLSGNVRNLQDQFAGYFKPF